MSPTKPHLRMTNAKGLADTHPVANEQGRDMNNIVFVELSKEVRNHLDSIPLSLEDLLSRIENNDRVHAELGHHPAALREHAQARSKNLGLTLIAAGVSSYLVCEGIANVMQSIFNRPILVEYTQYEEVREEGKVVRDQNGNPVLKKRRNSKLVYPNARRREQHSVDLNCSRLKAKFSLAEARSSGQPQDQE